MQALLTILKIISCVILGFSAIGFIYLLFAWLSKPEQNTNATTPTKPNTPAKPTIRMLNRDGDLREDEWHTYISGLPHHISKYDIGGFCGYVANDANNKFDNNAMGIYTSIKLLGYIPAKELEEYRDWCDAQPQPCVGFIFVEDGQIRGRVKILRPCNKEFLETEFSRYLQWVNDNYGAEYLPKTMSMQFDIK